MRIKMLLSKSGLESKLHKWCRRKWKQHWNQAESIQMSHWKEICLSETPAHSTWAHFVQAVHCIQLPPVTENSSLQYKHSQSSPVCFFFWERVDLRFFLLLKLPPSFWDTVPAISVCASGSQSWFLLLHPNFIACLTFACLGRLFLATASRSKVLYMVNLSQLLHVAPAFFF